jgi:maltoporin
MSAAVALACAAGSASAVDFSGYFRAGPASSGQDDNARACFGLPGLGWKYRTGNECDIYGEFLLSEKFAKESDTPFSVNIMPALYSGSSGSDFDRVGANSGTQKAYTDWGIAQLYADIKVGGITAWAGKRFYGRQDVYILDYKFTQFDGVGAGLQDISLGGSAKLAVSFFRKDGIGAQTTTTGTLVAGAQGPDQPGSRLNFDVTGIPLWTDGALRFEAALVKGTFNANSVSGAGTSGFQAGAIWTQKGVLGGDNNLVLQYSQGSAGINGNFGDLTAPSGTKVFRVLDTIYWQPTQNFGGTAVFNYEDRKSPAGSVKAYTLGTAMDYAITKNFKLKGELGLDRLTPVSGPSLNLTKVTFAPTITVGEGYWKRPELRFYVTHGKWNDAAAGAGGAAYADKTSGTSYGAQVEVWW